MLLKDHEPAAAGGCREDGTSRYLLTCDHASARIPERLGDLGLDAAQRARHIAWDIGALAVAQEMSRRLDAALLWQNYSRLVVDCNRQPSAADWIPLRSETTEIDANRDLSAAARAARAGEIFEPYQRAIGSALDRRAAAGRATVLIAVHSFTPVYKDQRRPWQLSLMYGERPELCRRVQRAITDDPQTRDLLVGINEPYTVEADADYGIPIHGDRRGLVNLQFEVRQDLIADRDGQRRWGERLARWLRQAAAPAAVSRRDAGAG